MNNLFNISYNWRKVTAIILLLNFFAVPLANAFPQTECNEACEMFLPFHECENSTAQMDMEDTCCEAVINANHNNDSAQCGMEYSDINCSIIISEQINSTYIIPKTIENKAEFIVISVFNVEEDISKTVFFSFSQEISFDSSPPIYLMISSFLI